MVVVLLTPASFGLVGEAYRGIYPSLSGSPQALALVRFALSILALAPATLLMGAALPTLTRYLSRGPRGLAGAFQRLYAANTIGAIGGTVIAGFVLIELLGLAGALRVGAVCSATAGLLALLLDRRSAPVAGTGKPVASPARTSSRGAAVPTGPSNRRLALGLAFVSGLTSLGYQVTWNRMLGAGTGSSTYVFTIILALFLVGIATGALILGVIRPSRQRAPVVIGIAQVLTAIAVMGGAAVLSSPNRPFNGIEPEFVDSLRAFAVSAALVVLPATIAMGLTFPATASLIADEAGSEGSAAGSLLAVNTFGSIIATFALPFVVIPIIGSPATLAALAVLNALVGGALLVRAAGESSVVRVLGGATSALVSLVVIVALIAGTAFRNPTTRLITLGGGEVYAATEDEIASVVAGKLNGAPQLWVAGTSMTLITVDTKLMPILPVMLRPHATRGLAVAFGMGTAFRTSLGEGIRTDVVELVPSVPSMFHWFYPDAPSVLANREGRVIIADGRNHVELTSETYDFIVVDPPPPIESSGVSVISSLEFYQASKARLTQDGVMVQWVPYGQTLDEFLAHVRTFLAVFPNVRVIAGAGGYGFYMVGSDGSVDLDPASMAAALARPGVLDDLNGAPDSRNRSAADWIATLQANTWAAGETLRTSVGDGPLITDDRPLPEYFLIRRLTQAKNTPGMNLGTLRALLK